jgi:two-component system, LytTR family, response regulator
MIKTLIIEDEAKVRESLSYMLEKYCPQVSVCAVATTFEEGYRLVNQHNPELVFVDIQLNSQEGTGIDLLYTLSLEGVAIIFISGFKEYAVDAFRLNAVDYLLKPINIQQLTEAVERAKTYLLKNKSISSKITNLFATTIHIPTTHGFMIFQQSDIMHCKADGPYTHFFMNGKTGKITSSVNLGQVEQKLDKNVFFRVHKSHIINRHYVKEYHRGEGGTVKMANQTEIPVSRIFKEDFLTWLG